jgi:hypothetical protein
MLNVFPAEDCVNPSPPGHRRTVMRNQISYQSLVSVNCRSFQVIYKLNSYEKATLVQFALGKVRDCMKSKGPEIEEK